MMGYGWAWLTIITMILGVIGAFALAPILQKKSEMHPMVPFTVLVAEITGVWVICWQVIYWVGRIVIAVAEMGEYAS